MNLQTLFQIWGFVLSRTLAFTFCDKKKVRKSFAVHNVLVWINYLKHFSYQRVY